MRDLNSTFYKTAQKSKLAQIKTKRTKLDTDGRFNSDWKALRKKTLTIISPKTQTSR